MTIDELAASAGTTTRHVRSLQTIGLLPRPELRARTGLYGARHLARLVGVLRLQDEGFSLRSLSAPLRRPRPGRIAGFGPRSGTGARPHRGTGDAAAADGDSAELYGFVDARARGAGRRSRCCGWSRPPCGTTGCGTTARRRGSPNVLVRARGPRRRPPSSLWSRGPGPRSSGRRSPSPRATAASRRARTARSTWACTWATTRRRSSRTGVGRPAASASISARWSSPSRSTVRPRPWSGPETRARHDLVGRGRPGHRRPRDREARA